MGRDEKHEKTKRRDKMVLETLAQSMVNGILLGGLYSLMAVGLSLCFGVMGIANSAQASMAVLGAYISFWLFTLYGLEPFFSIAISAAILFMLGVGIYRSLIIRIVNLPDRTIISFLLLSAVSIVMVNSTAFAWGSTYRAIYTGYTATSVTIGGLVLPMVRVACFVISMGVIIALMLLLKFTRIGKAMRAVAQDRDAAKLMGINVNRVGSTTVGIAAALSGVAGTFMALIYSFYPEVQGLWIAKLYAIVIFGGMGSISGAMFAALLFGIVEAVIGVYIPTMWAHITAFAILLLTLFIRPTGLLGGKRI